MPNKKVLFGPHCRKPIKKTNSINFKNKADNSIKIQLGRKTKSDCKSCSDVICDPCVLNPNICYPKSLKSGATYESVCINDLNAEVNSSIYSIVEDLLGNIYIGGSFSQINGESVNRIAKYNLNTGLWSSLDTGVSSTIYALIIDSNNDVIVGGQFTTAGGNAANRIAKWSHVTQTWSTYGSGFNNTVYDIAIDSQGTLYVTGRFTTGDGNIVNGVAYWDGTTWQSLGTGLSNTFTATGNTLGIDSQDNIYVAGSFNMAGGVATNNVAKWDGTVWSSLGAGLSSSANKIIFSSTDIMYITGGFTSAGSSGAEYIAQWDGSNWASVGNSLSGTGENLFLDKTEENLFVVGSFEIVADIIANRLAKYNFADDDWTTYGSGLNSTSYSLLVDNNNDFYIGGAFTITSGITVARLAKYEFEDITVPAGQDIQDCLNDYETGFIQITIVPLPDTENCIVDQTLTISKDGMIILQVDLPIQESVSWSGYSNNSTFTLSELDGIYAQINIQHTLF